MPIFVYSARNIYGKKLKGELVCDSRQDALNNLKLQKLFAFRLNEKRMNYRQKSTGKVNAAASIKKKSISIFARQFASMLRAEIPLSEILDILSTGKKSGIQKNTQIYKRRYSQGWSTVNGNVEV